MAQLNARGRKRIKRSNFASPKGTGDDKGKDAYPIHDLAHARNALARVAQHGSPEEQRRVKRAVYAKYPQLKRNAEMNNRIRKASGR